MKKALCLVLSLVMACAMCVCGALTAFAAGGTYTVAGDKGLTGISWDPSSNTMTAGTYTYEYDSYDYAITFDNVETGSYSFKITDGTWNNSWGLDDGGNYSIVLSDAGNVTIYFDFATKNIAVDSPYLVGFQLESVTVAGNGDGTWLNGASWDTTDESNDMTEVQPGVWQITYTDVEAFDDYQFKICINHSWTYCWTSDSVFDGQTNPSNVVEQNGSTVCITIDLNGFDFDSKSGFVFIDFDVQSNTPAAGDNTVTTVGGSKSAEVKGTYVAGSAAETVYSVDIAWGGMEFTYTDGAVGTWDAEKHTYTGATNGSWSCDTDANKITVTNHSNAAVDAVLSYANEAAYSEIGGSFTNAEGAAISSTLQLATAAGTLVANAPTADAFLKLSGALSSGVTDTKIGTVTVTITNHAGVGAGEGSLID